MSNNLRPWNAVPYDKRMKPGTRMFMDWARSATARLAGVLEPLPAVNLTAEGVAGGVALSWEEVPNAGVYLCFEAENIGEIDFPFAVVRSKGTGSNGTVRSGAEDTNTRFYYVQAVSPLGVLGNLSDPVEQGAGSAVNLTGLDDLILPDSIQLFREDFLTGTATASSFTTGFLGGASGTGSTVSFQNGAFPYTGVFRLGLNAGAASSVSYTLANAGGGHVYTQLGKVWNNPGALNSDGTTILPKDSFSGWHVIVIFRFVDDPVAIDVMLLVGFSSDSGGIYIPANGQDAFGIRHRKSIGYFEIFQKRGNTSVIVAPTIHNLVWEDDHGTPASVIDTNWHRLDLISFNGPQLTLQHGSIFMHCYLDGRQMVENFFFEPPFIIDTGTGNSGALTLPMSFHAAIGVEASTGGLTRNIEFDYLAMQFTRQQPINPVFPRWFLEAPVSP